MGVDLSITVAVGILLDEGGIEAVRAEFSDDLADTYWGEGILDWVNKTHDIYMQGIGHGNAGSYYDNDPMQEYIYVTRLTKHYSDYNMPAGILAGPTDASGGGITAEEHNRLVRIAQVLGTPYPSVRSFTAVLWH